MLLTKFDVKSKEAIQPDSENKAGIQMKDKISFTVACITYTDLWLSLCDNKQQLCG